MINFGAGPAALPEEVLLQASEAIRDYNGSGMSILEIPHRGNQFADILNEAHDLVKKLMHLDDMYEVMWMQGGGRLQFAMLPMNFLDKNKTAGYIESGHWAEDAAANARLYGNVEIIASSKNQHYTYVPEISKVHEHLEYLHITTNNTIYGTQFNAMPETDVPFVADMSSDIFSRPLDFNQFGLIYAVAQKNIGAAGVTLVLARKDFIEKGNDKLPGILSYKKMALHNSMVNTPPVFAIYTSLLTLRWIERTGLDMLEKANHEKAALLYNAIDESAIFHCVAREDSRSNMNVCFRCIDEATGKCFLEFALAHHITGIKGHRSVGGFRVSLYNAIRLENVKELIAVMKEFENRKG